MNPLVNKKDFDQALSELGITKKEWIRDNAVNGKPISAEWLRKILNGAACSPDIEEEITSTVIKGEEARRKRHKKRQIKQDTYESYRSTSRSN